jgi:hypothetical protein
LLDYLATEFVKNNWSVKQLIREIALSRIYRTDSKFNKKSFEADPENKFVWRVEPRRLDAEVLRDSILRISGQLDSERPRASLVAEFGTGIVRDGTLVSTSGTANPNISTGMMARFGGNFRQRRGPSNNSEISNRPAIARIDQSLKYRSVYLPVLRDNLPRSMEVFDFAEPSMVVGTRETSNTPDQGLYFLNNEFVIQQSDAIALRIMKEKQQVREQIKYAFLLAYGRQATSSELSAAENFYNDFEAEARFGRRGEVSFKKLSALCQAIVGSAEFRFLN